MTVSIDTHVWTGTTTAGDFDATPIMLGPSSCVGWSGAGGSTELATIGVPTARDGAWTNGGAGNCFAGVGFAATLYCIER